MSQSMTQFLVEPNYLFIRFTWKRGSHQTEVRDYPLTDFQVLSGQNTPFFKSIQSVVLVVGLFESNLV